MAFSCLNLEEINELIKLNTAASFTIDLASARQGRLKVLSNSCANGVSKKIHELNNPQTKLTLANNLVTQFHQMRLDQPSEFLARLKVSLQILNGQDATTPLIAKTDELYKKHKIPTAASV